MKLARLQPEHVAPFYRWRRDPKVMAYSRWAFQGRQTTRQIDQWLAATRQQANSLNLGIYLVETNVLIGYAGLVSISATNHAAAYFLLIGERTWWGPGVGRAGTRQVRRIGCTNCHLNRSRRTVSEWNRGGVKA